MGTSIQVKTEKELAIMAEGGEKLGRVKLALKKAVKIGGTAAGLEGLANKLIAKEGGTPSFKGVPGYHWATCVNVNAGVVHGIPNAEIIFKKGDVVSVDVGMKYRGFHTDTSFSVGLSSDRKTARFLEVGERALKKAIEMAKPGNRVYDISETIERQVRGAGLTPVEDLVGHGIGKDLHEEPQIPCFSRGKREESPLISQGAVLAIEVMYVKGKKDLVLGHDGWTISTADGKIAALFEETVAVTSGGPLILTEDN